MSDSIRNNKYRIERLSKQNLNDLEKLHRAVYRRPHPADYFQKKYDTAYTGTEYIGYIAYNEKDEPIAYYGVIPCFIRYQDQLILAAQAADTMTDTRYQYKGLFVQLANRTVDLCADENINLIFGFPNQNSLHGFLVKLKWQMTESMDCYIIPIGIISAGKWAKKIPFVKKIYTDYRQRLLNKYLVSQKGIENSVLKEGFAGVNRNALYLHYKTYNDTHVIKIDNALIWIRLRNNLIIGDMDCPREEFDDVMYKLQKFALRLGMKEIHFHTSHQTLLSAWFAERYDAIPSFYVLFKNLGCNIPLDKIKFTFADIDTF